MVEKVGTTTGWGSDRSWLYSATSLRLNSRMARTMDTSSNLRSTKPQSCGKWGPLAVAIPEDNFDLIIFASFKTTAKWFSQLTRHELDGEPGGRLSREDLGHAQRPPRPHQQTPLQLREEALLGRAL